MLRRPERRRLRTALLYLGTLVLVTAAAVVPTAAPAAASVCTSNPGCGGTVINHTTRSIMVTNCWSGGSTYAGFYPPCTTNYDPYAYNSWMYLGPYASTTGWFYYWDTDAFQAPAGCVTWWWIEGVGVNYYIDRVGKSALWTKIVNIDVAHIGGVWC